MTYFLSEKDGAPVLYYKPVQTGFPEDSDADVVASVCGGRTEFGDHACELLVRTPKYTLVQTAISKHVYFQVSSDAIASFPTILSSAKSDVVARTEYAWSRPISPHLAVKQEVIILLPMSLYEIFDAAPFYLLL